MLIPSDHSFILASGSPRRRDLLEAAGLSFRVQSASCDESWQDDGDVLQYVARVAREKGMAAHQRFGPSWSFPTLVLSADTIVWVQRDRPPLGKPADRQEAHDTLQTLFAAGEHQVTTGFCLQLWSHEKNAEPRRVEKQVSSRVWMRRPTPEELNRYLDSGEWQDKAGAYGIQGAAAGLVSGLEGSYTNVVGLPLAQVLESLSLIF